MDIFSKEKINWKDDESFVCLPHSTRDDEAKSIVRLISRAPKLPGHLWVSSSGSSQKPGESLKWIALSKMAFLTSADVSNLHLDVTPEDSFGVVLPLSHVGGVSILTRAYLSTSRTEFYFDENPRWEPVRFQRWAELKKITLLSLVPTQIYDLCAQELIAPASIRAILVGGGRLDSAIYKKARDLGWPCLPSFGMTECCSQIATAELSSLLTEQLPSMKVLSHVAARTENDALYIKSGALFSGFIQERQGEIFFENPIEDGWFRTSDQVSLEFNDRGTFLEPRGRAIQWAKVKGYNVFLPAIRDSLIDHLKTLDWTEKDWMVAFKNDEREGAQIVFVHRRGEEAENLRQLLTLWKSQNPSFPEIAEIQIQATLPRTDLGKDKIWL